MLNGKIDAIETDPTEWFWDPRGDDFAILPLSIHQGTHRYSLITEQIFMTEQDIVEYHIGFGDDVFMLGLFVDHNRGVRQVPKARFGNISMMPDKDAPILQPNGHKGTDFVMDMHSRAGFSGSPVFMYRTYGSDFSWVNKSEELKRNPEQFLRSPPLFCFAGIHWGQFPEKWELVRGSAEAKEEVRGMSGMTCVIPAWRIQSVLNRPEFVRMRKQVEEDFRAKNPEIRFLARRGVCAPRSCRLRPACHRREPHSSRGFRGALAEGCSTF